MARASVAGENGALNGLDGTGSTNVIGFVSLHTGDPATTGANENPATGGYARQACSWAAASGGSKTNTTALTFSTAGTTPVSYFGTNASVSGANYSLGGALTSAVTAATITFAAGSLTLTAS